MIDSRADRRFGRAGLAAALCLFLMGFDMGFDAPAAAGTRQIAQAGPQSPPRPLILAPPARPHRQPPPAPIEGPVESLRPLPGASEATARPVPDPLRRLDELSPETAQPGEASVAPVGRGALARIDPESTGTLEDANGGLGIDLWDGTRRSLVERVLPLLPTAPRSRVMRDLMRRLLLTAARAPQGQPADAAGRRNLLALRLNLLLEMGLVDDAARLLRLIPVGLQPGTLARTRVETLMLAEDAPGACRDADARIAGAKDVYWLKVMIFCQAMDQEIDKAALGVELLRESGEDDPLFFSLIGALAGYGKVETGDGAEASSLHLAMLSAAKLPLPADLTDDDRPRILRAVARSAGAPLEPRLEAAERAVAMAVLPPAELAELYARVEFSQEQLEDPFRAVEDMTGSRARALLFQAASRQTVPTARGEVLKRLWARAMGQGGYVTAVRVTVPLLRELKPAPELAWLAAEAGRSLYAAGLATEARPWLDLLRREAATDPAARTELTKLWPLARIADGDASLPWEASFLEAWREATLADGGAPAKVAKVGALLTLLDALSEPIIGGDWEALYQGVPGRHELMPPPWVWFGLRGAAERKLRGETLLFSLLSIGDSGLAIVSPVVLHHVIISLRLVGFEPEARAFALEAAVANGI
ncbi:MAG: hypothetical protein ACE5JZ_11195 [Kiloniellales bacterium]